MEINLITVSKISSEIINTDTLIIKNIIHLDLNELFDAIYDKYPRLEKCENYKLFWRYARNIFLEIFDYISYVTALRLTVDLNIYLLVIDVDECWEDNISYLEELDKIDEEERRERERDIYDVKIIRKGEADEVIEEVKKVDRVNRTNQEILCFALRKFPEMRFCTADLSLRFAMIEDFVKGWPKIQNQVIIAPIEIVFEKRGLKKEKGKDKGKKDKDKKGKEKQKGGKKK